jgi:hypothetical protein
MERTLRKRKIRFEECGAKMQEEEAHQEKVRAQPTSPSLTFATDDASACVEHCFGDMWKVLQQGFVKAKNLDPELEIQKKSCLLADLENSNKILRKDNCSLQLQVEQRTIDFAEMKDKCEMLQVDIDELSKLGW